MQDRLTLEYCQLGSLRPYTSNPRSHPKSQIAELAKMITSRGFTNPILADENGEIIAGHGRYLAAKLLELQEVPIVRLRGLSAAEKVAARIADNKIAQKSGWTVELLELEFQKISVLDASFDLTLTGYTAAEIDPMLNPKVLPDDDDDALPKLRKLATTRPGDIWIAGKHRVGCGDCGDLAFLQQIVGEQSVDGAFLDPPYNLKVDGNVAGAGRHREFMMASGEMSDAEFRAFLNDRLGACVKVSKDGAVHFVSIDHRHVEHVADVGAALYGTRLNIAVWVKSNGGMGSLYRSRHEFVMIFRVGKAAHYNSVELGKHGRTRTNVWEYPSANSLKGDRRQDLKLHPTVKPFRLVADAIRDVTRPGEIVLDGFLGSGTTLLACERTGRVCRGVEIDPQYVDCAIERWMDATGGEPYCEATGELYRARRTALCQLEGN